MSVNDVAQVVKYDRDEFVKNVWTYNTGEHVSFIGPTGSGKTTLAYQLLEETGTKEVPAVVLVMKPRDETVKKFSKQAQYRIIPSWPPVYSIWNPGKKNGYVVWPKHTFNPDMDDERHERVFTQTLRSCYARGEKILFADEVYSLTKELHLERELRRIWTKGRSMGCGLWAATQRPMDVPLLMYSSPEHIFLAYDPDRRSQQRFSEIGGVDPEIIKFYTSRLPRYEWFYVRRSDRSACIIGS